MVQTCRQLVRRSLQEVALSVMTGVIETDVNCMIFVINFKKQTNNLTLNIPAHYSNKPLQNLITETM